MDDSFKAELIIDVTDGEFQSKTQKALERLNQIEEKMKKMDRMRMNPVVELADRASPHLGVIARKLDRLTRGAHRVLITAKDLASPTINRIKGAASAIGIGGTIGVGAFVGSSIKKSMDFEAQLSEIKALTGSDNKQMEEIRKLTMSLGASTKYSALESAQGVMELLKAGMDIDTIKGSGAQASLNLASAGGLELPDAAEIMATSQNAFRDEKGLDATKISNVLAGTANASAASVQELKYALAQVAPSASAARISFEETNTALGLLANNGIKGSDAGTSLKTMFASLQPDTKAETEAFQKLGFMTAKGTNAFYDQTGKMKSLTQIAGILKKNMSGLNDQQRTFYMNQIFGQDATRAANILYKEGAEGFRNMQKEMSKVTAFDVAKEKMNNAKGAIEEMKGSFETLQMVAGGAFEKPLVNAANFLQNKMDVISKQVEVISEAIAFMLNDLIVISTSNNDWNDAGARTTTMQGPQMDFADKVVLAMDVALDKLDVYASGPGGKKIEKIFTKLLEIGIRAWGTALTGSVKNATTSLAEGNIAGAAGWMVLANLLGFGAIAKGGGSFLKWILGKTKMKVPLGGSPLPVNTPTTVPVGAAGKVAKTVAVTAEATTKNMPFWLKETLAAGKYAGKKIAIPFAIAFSVADVSSKVKKGESLGQAVGETAGSFAGMAMGTKLGAMGGAYFGPYGVVIGGALGGIIGSVAGEKAVQGINNALANINLSSSFNMGAGSVSPSRLGQLNVPGKSMVQIAGETIPKNHQINTLINAKGAVKEAGAAHFASGGIIDRPILTTAAEEGPEAIIPLGGRFADRGRMLLQKAASALGVKSIGNTSSSFSQQISSAGQSLFQQSGQSMPRNTPSLTPAISVGSSGMQIGNIGPFIFGNEEADEDIAKRIMRIIMTEIKKAKENRG